MCSGRSTEIISPRLATKASLAELRANLYRALWLQTGASASGDRPDRTSATISYRNSGGYRGCFLAIADSSFHCLTVDVSTKAGQLQNPAAASRELMAGRNSDEHPTLEAMRC